MSAKMFSLLVLQVFLNLAVSEGVEYLGCFKERSISDRLLKGDFKDFIRSNTPEMCRMHCSSKGYNFAAVQFETQCFCSNDRPSYDYLADSEGECSMACAGDRDQKCGAYMRLNVYSLEEDAIALSYVGCYSGVSLTRTSVSGPLTREACKDSCARMGHRYFAMEGGSRCHCGSDLNGYKVRQEHCRAPCDGDKTHICGGYSQQFSIYRTGVQVSEGVEYLGCFKERSISDRLLKGDFKDFIRSNTPEMCWMHCASKGYNFAAVQFGTQCFCSNDRPSYDYLADSEGECSMACAGDRDQKCGAYMRLSVYSLEEDAIALSYVGCYSGVSLTRTSVSGPLTRKDCKDSCARMGHRYFAMEGGSRCHCGSDLKGYMAREEECRAPCDGDKTQICGGYNKQFSIYRTEVQEEPQQSWTTKKPKHKSSSSSSNSSSSSSSSSSEEKKNKHRNKRSSPKVAVEESVFGCYQDKEGKLFDFKLDLPNQNTPKMCLGLCGQMNYKFAGLQSDKCFCSKDQPDKKYSTKNMECNKACPGDRKKACGGIGATNVYEIKYEDEW